MVGTAPMMLQRSCDIACMVASGSNDSDGITTAQPKATLVRTTSMPAAWNIGTGMA